MSVEYRILVTFKNGKQYAAPKEQAVVVFKPYLKQIRNAVMQSRGDNGVWHSGINVDYHDGTFDVLFGGGEGDKDRYCYYCRTHPVAPRKELAVTKTKSGLPRCAPCGRWVE